MLLDGRVRDTTKCENCAFSFGSRGFGLGKEIITQRFHYNLLSCQCPGRIVYLPTFVRSGTMQHRACHLRAVSLRDFATFIGELTAIRAG